MDTGLNPVLGAARLAGRQPVSDGEWRYAGQQLGINPNAYEGMNKAGLDDLRRIRTDKAIPRSFSNLMEIRPELSEPGYSESGGYQPSVAYGA